MNEINYKDLIIGLLEKIEDEKILAYFYYFIKGKLKAGE